MFELLKKADKPIIYFTAAVILLAGFLRVINFSYSKYILTYGLLPYIVIRGLYNLSIAFSKKRTFSKNGKLRLYVYSAILVTVVLSLLDLFSADFFVMFLIMVDYLLLREPADEV